MYFHFVGCSGDLWPNLLHPSISAPENSFDFQIAESPGRVANYERQNKYLQTEQKKMDLNGSDCV
jgi:hypothetical protein